MTADVIEVVIGDETKKIKMSFGLLNECAKVIGDIDNITEISLNPEIRDRLLIEVLSARDEMGVITDPISVFNLDMTPEAVITLLDWVGSHVADFFLNSMTRVKDLLTSREEKLKSLMPTSNGGEA